jgi:hypothetical protein
MPTASQLDRRGPRFVDDEVELQVTVVVPVRVGYHDDVRFVDRPEDRLLETEHASTEDRRSCAPEARSPSYWLVVVAFAPSGVEPCDPLLVGPHIRIVRRLLHEVTIAATTHQSDSLSYTSCSYAYDSLSH